MKKEIDLSSNERKILLSLELPGTLAEVSRRLKIPRSTAEYCLHNLINTRWVVTTLKGKRRIYSLVSKHKAAPTSSPILRLGPITVYTGTEAIEELWKEVAEQSKGSRLIGVQPRSSFKEAIKKSKKGTVTTVSQTITDKKFIVDAIVHEDLARSIFAQYSTDAKSVAQVFTNRLEDMVKVDQSFLDEKSEMFMINNFSFFVDWFNEVAVKIENKNINNLLKSLYQATKAYGKRYEQGKHIEKLISELK